MHAAIDAVSPSGPTSSHRLTTASWHSRGDRGPPLTCSADLASNESILTSISGHRASTPLINSSTSLCALRPSIRASAMAWTTALRSGMRWPRAAAIFLVRIQPMPHLSRTDLISSTDETFMSAATISAHSMSLMRSKVSRQTTADVLSSSGWSLRWAAKTYRQTCSIAVTSLTTSVLRSSGLQLPSKATRR